MRTILFIALLALGLAAQTVEPSLSPTERMALSLIQQHFKAANDELAAFKADFAAAHPGWTYSEVHGVVKTEAKK